MLRKCPRCGHAMSAQNPGNFCFACQREKIEEITEQDKDLHYTVADVRVLLGLESDESVRRLARQGRLPPPVPEVKRWLWFRNVFDDWIKSGYTTSAETSKLNKAILKATELGYPVGQLTLSGHDPQNLIDTLEDEGFNLDEGE